MAIPQLIPSRVTPEEYLALERQAEYKSEYIDGYIVAMSGGTPNHSRLKLDLSRVIANQLLGGPCEPFDSDLMVRVDPDRYTYPDLTVVCGEAVFDDDLLLNPAVIFEVLSPSTESEDRGEKWQRYRRMPSLRQYVLVSQKAPLIEVYTRSGDVWTYSDADGLNASIHLASIDCTLALREVYARITFEDSSPSPATAASDAD